MPARSSSPAGRLAWPLLLLLAAAPACKKDSPSSDPPSLSNLSLSRTSAGVQEGGGSVPVGFSLEVADAGANVSSLTLTILDAAGTQLARDTGSLQNPSGATSGAIQGTLSMPTTATGAFTVRFQAGDARGARSNELEATFTVVPGAGAPALAAISPSSAEAGATGLILTVTGSGFAVTSVVLWNGSSLGTTFVDSGTLQASVPYYDLSFAGTAQVTVYTPAPGGGTSNAATFTVTLPAPRPVPVLTSITPSAVDAGGGDLTLAATGNDFSPSSQVQWNGSPLVTTFVGPTELRATLSSYQLSQVGRFPVNVFTPAPGGGTSSPVTFEVRVPSMPGVTVLALPAQDVAWDPYGRKLYLSVPSTSPKNPNTITVLDPFTGELGAAQYAGSEPGALAFSADGQFLYVGHAGASEVIRFSLPGLTQDLRIPLGRDATGGAYVATSLAVDPFSPHAVAVSLSSPPFGPTATAVFDDATARAGRGGASASVCWGNFYTLYAASAYGDLDVYTVDARGLAPSTTYRGAFSGAQIQRDAGTRLLYSPDGRAIDPETGALAGTFSVGYTGGAMVPDSSLGSAFFATSQYYGSSIEIRAFDLARYVPTASMTLTYVASPAARMVRWGADGLAILNGGQVVLVRGPFVLPAATSPNPAPAVDAIWPSSARAGSGNLGLFIDGTGFVPGSVVRVNGAERSTRRLSATQLDAYLPASDLAAAGVVSITVANPAPGGGTSAAASFTVTP